MSTKKKKDEHIDKLILTIKEELTDLTKEHKLKEIIKKYSNIKDNISDVSEKLEDIKKSFDAILEIKKEIIDDITYEKYCKELDSFDNDIIDNLSLEEQILKYRIYTKKIIACENYLKSKKLTIINCDDIDNKKTISTESESTAE